MACVGDSEKTKFLSFHFALSRNTLILQGYQVFY